jgi:MSHA biogenesis protein MshK
MRGLCALAGTALLLDPAWCDSLSDPTQPPQSASAATVAPGQQPAASAYTVQAIVFGPRRRLAVVNGQEVHPGSTVGGARVVAITSGAVTLEVAGHRQILPIHPDVNHDFALNPSAPAMRGAEASTP